MSWAIFIQSCVTVLLTSIVPLLIFFLIGPILLSPIYQSIALAGLVSLAVGSLLGDVFFHLIPEIFELKGDYLRNCIFMLVGVLVFFMGERLLQHYHQGHGHGHLDSSVTGETHFSAVAGSPIGNNLEEEEEEGIELDKVSFTESGSKISTIPRHQMRASTTSRLTQGKKPVGMLVLTSDFIHNFVDGVAIGVSFATSFSVGVSTSIAVFLHEIPHELGDFAILLNAGYSPRTVVICNVLTTISSFLGAAIALLLVDFGTDQADPSLTHFSVSIKPAILSLTAGNFLYIALADLIPELLQHGQQNKGESSSGLYRRWIPLIQYGSFIFGAGMMLLIKVYTD